MSINQHLKFIKSQFVNDFENKNLPMTKFVEDLKSITIQKLTRTGDWQERDIYVSQKGFRLEWLFVKLINDPIHRDWYLEILNPGPHCSCTAITITQTSCRFGGYRYWFQCPDCEQRCGLLRISMTKNIKSYGTRYRSLKLKCQNMAKLTLNTKILLLQ